MNSYFLTVFIVLVCSFSLEKVDCSTAVTCSFDKSVNLENLQKFFNPNDQNKDLIATRNLFAEFIASYYFEIKKFFAQREDFLISRLSQDNIIELYLWSIDNGLQNLVQKSQELLQKLQIRILGNKNYLNLDYDTLYAILTEITYGNENDENLREKMFNFIISWAQKDLKNREPHLPELLDILPLQKLSYSFLKENVLTNNLIQKYTQIIKFIQELLKKPPPKLTGPQLYFLGGENGANYTLLSSVSKVNVEINEWRNMPEMSNPRRSFGAAVLGKRIYIGGGFTKNSKVSNQFEVFDCEDNTWKELAPMRYPRTDNGMATLNGDVFVAGGFDSKGLPIASVLRYSPSINKWTEVKEMLEKRGSHQLVTLNDTIYAIGGNVKTVEKYNALIDEWTYVATPHHKYYYGSATPHENKIFVLTTYGFEVYDPQTNKWTDLPKPPVGWASQLVSIKDKLWAIGGGTDANVGLPTKKVFEFDTNKKTWTQLQDMDIERKNHRAVVVNY